MLELVDIETRSDTKNINFEREKQILATKMNKISFSQIISAKNNLFRK